MIYLQLFWEFFKVGLFTVGGGMAAVPLLLSMADSTGWFTQDFVVQMIAISESTPGPIGINMATYAGYTVGGIPGGIIASIATAIPGVVIVVLVSRVLQKFSESTLVKDAFYGLRPAVTALIAYAAFTIINKTMIYFTKFGTVPFLESFSWQKVLFFGVMLFGIMKFKKHPVIYIVIAAVVGIVFKF